MASTLAAAKRINIERSKLATVPDHSEWDTIAYYIAQLCVAVTVIVSPHVIVLGGGMLRNAKLFPMIRKYFSMMLNNYIQIPEIQTDEGLDKYIVPSRLNREGSKTTSGTVGCLQIGLDEYIKTKTKL